MTRFSCKPNGRNSYCLDRWQPMGFALLESWLYYANIDFQLGLTKVYSSFYFKKTQFISIKLDINCEANRYENKRYYNKGPKRSEQHKKQEGKKKRLKVASSSSEQVNNVSPIKLRIQQVVYVNVNMPRATGCSEATVLLMVGTFSGIASLFSFSFLYITWLFEPIYAYLN